MPAPFTKQEYQKRLDSVRTQLATSGLDALIIGDPANMNWLTGFDAWSFYVPQIMLVLPDHDPVWMGRKMDAGAVPLTTYLDADCVRPYEEHLVQQTDIHPMTAVAEFLGDYNLSGKRVGYESDTYYFSPRSLHCLQSGQPGIEWVDADRLVNWCRIIKSDDEIQIMREAANIVENAMRVAYKSIQPGMRQCDLMAAILAAQITGTEESGGDLTALSPLILVGEAASTAHPMWTDEKFEKDQTVALELGGCRKRYNAGLARTLQLGQGSEAVYSTAEAVKEGLDAVLEVIQPGILAHDVHAAWQSVLDQHNLVKESRIGYSIGVGYSPDWGEHTLSLRKGDETPLQENMTLHVMLGMWMDGWGMEISETVLVTDSKAECLTRFPRDVHRV
ncbi:MAG: Xaa-Pro peptidase family protein [Pseudomonadota bacterium]